MWRSMEMLEWKYQTVYAIDMIHTCHTLRRISFNEADVVHAFWDVVHIIVGFVPLGVNSGSYLVL